MNSEETRELPASNTGDLAPSAIKVPGLEDQSIGVALSGGGVRAALFSLGALIGLVESGEHTRVTNISSVSGGSIVNAAVAQSCAFSRTDPANFHEIVKPIAEGLCRRGTFALTPGRVAVLLYLTCLLPLWLGVSLVEFYGDAVPWSRINVRWFAVMVLALSIALQFLLRGVLQEIIYRSFLGSLNKGREKNWRGRRLRDFEESPTSHVIVATDLVSAAPVFFSRTFVYCPTYGWGEPGRTRTASAVYASAAFPVVFPVRRFRRRPFRFQNGASPPPYPRLLKMNDGGVYNNLGTDWFDELDRQSRLKLWRYGNRTLSPALLPVERRIVVNAGAASRSLRRVPPFLALTRTMSVLYDNTVRPRLQTMRENARADLNANIVIDIKESPYHIARRLAELRCDDFPVMHREHVEGCRSRAEAVAEIFGTEEEGYWIEFARQTSTTKTKLTRAGLEPGARMMLHGYLSTIVAMHVLHGVGLPEPLKDEGFFLNLAGRPPASATFAPASDIVDPSAGPAATRTLA